MQVIISCGCSLGRGLAVHFKIFISFIILLVLFCEGVTYAEPKKAYIETPSPCYKVEKIEDTKVYLLKSTAEDCVQIMGKVQIEIDESIKHVFIYTDGKFWKEQTVKEFNLDSITEYMEKVDDLKKDLKVPENLYKEKGQEMAEKTYQFYQSKEFQEKLRAETERLKEGVFQKAVKDYYAENREIEKTKGKLLPTERIYIFVSSSVPLQTLRNYVLAMDRLGDPNIVMVMRGFVDGMEYIKPTIKFVGDILRKDPSCDMTKQKCETYRADFQIDPLLFRRYQIAKVPAVVYATDVNVMDVQMSEGLESNTEMSNYYVLYGDASLEYVLDTIQKETKSKSIERLLTALRKGFY
jgi:conjugal transfer pilus assembly protein TrbC